MTNFKMLFLKNKVGKTILFSIKQIEIPKKFIHTPPRPDKLREKYRYYRKYKTFQSPIAVDKNGVLVDGYTSYLLAKMFGIKRIAVTIV